MIRHFFWLAPIYACLPLLGCVFLGKEGFALESSINATVSITVINALALVIPSWRAAAILSVILTMGAWPFLWLVAQYGGIPASLLADILLASSAREGWEFVLANSLAPGLGVCN